MSKQKPLHSPPPITRSDFQAGYIKPASYSRQSISAAIIDHRRRTEEELTPRQKTPSNASTMMEAVIWANPIISGISRRS
jgi:hypothetical protein